MPVWSQTAWFSDGYHGGVYAHYPMWQARFTIENLIDFIPMASPHKGYFDSEFLLKDWFISKTNSSSIAVVQILR